MPFGGEEEFLNTILRVADANTWMDRRSARLHQGLETLPDGAKAVIFCASEENADRVFRYLKDCKVKVVRHGAGDDEDLLGAGSWRDFLDIPDVRAIVCGHCAEEGINLQGGNKAIIHFDLPLQPNRVEQRMGRVDRYGAGRAVPSFVLIDGNAPLQMAWFRILEDGYGTEFVESIRSFSELDVRGRSYAMWRQFPGEFLPMEIRTCFRFDFLVEIYLDGALEVLAQARNRTKESARSSLARRGDTLFRPTVIQLWLDEEGDELPTEFVDR